MQEINVMIVDDHPLFRQGLRDVIEGLGEGLNVIAEAADGQKAIELAQEHKPNVILMDINLPTINGLQVTKRIMELLPKTRVITITGYDDSQQVLHALRAGARGYCPKDIMPDTLVHVIRKVSKGYYAVGEQVMIYEELDDWLHDKLGVHNALAGGGDSVFQPLSPREMEILEHVTHGYSNKEIALKLKISHQTVKNHMTAILRKLGVHDRTQAAVHALTNGWVRPEDKGDAETAM